MHPHTLLPLSFAALALAVCAPLAVHAGGPLETEMKSLKKITKELANLGDQFDNGVELATQAKSDIAKSRERVPAVVADLKDETAKNAALAEYKKQMDELAAGFDKVIEACKAKDSAMLKAALDDLNKLKKKGHKDFTKDD